MCKCVSYKNLKVDLILKIAKKSVFSFSGKHRSCRPSIQDEESEPQRTLQGGAKPSGKIEQNRGRCK